VRAGEGESAGGSGGGSGKSVSFGEQEDSAWRLGLAARLDGSEEKVKEKVAVAACWLQSPFHIPLK